MLKKVLIGIALIIAGVLGAAALQPDAFRVERSLAIAAPADQLFAQVNDLKKFNIWSPWAKVDPNAKAVFAAQTEGVGASFSWDGNYEVGKGSMTNIESRPNELVRFRMDFIKPFESTDTAEFTFKPENGKTVVTWLIYGNSPKTYLCKLMGMIFGADKMVGEQFEKGLNDLKSLAEGQGK